MIDRDTEQAQREMKAARFVALLEQRRRYHGTKPVMRSNPTMLGIGLFLLFLFSAILLVIITSP